MKLRIAALMAMASFLLPAFSADTPSFPGGEKALEKYISDNMVYPSYSKENGVEGVVTVGFIVATDGTLKDSKIMKPVDPDLEKEALRLVNGMPAWIPAEKDGTPIEAPSQVKVPFILDD